MLTYRSASSPYLVLSTPYLLLTAYNLQLTTHRSASSPSSTRTVPLSVIEYLATSPPGRG
eukprot:scaffold55158_cov59-Phaeocystis_antarctica.AAC.3